MLVAKHRVGLVAYLIFLVGVILATAGAQAAKRRPLQNQKSPLSASQILARARPAVVIVAALDEAGELQAQGSGVLVRSDGVVLTAWHVVSGATDIVVKTPSGGFYSVAGVLSWDRTADYAVVKLEAKGLPSASLGDSGAVRQGDRVFAVGSPMGLEATASEGIISAVRLVPEQGKLLQITAAVSPGSSGGPVLNAKGEVVGIALFMLEGGRNLNFAIPINLVKPALRTKRKVTTVADLRAALRAKAAQFYRRGMAAEPDDDNAPNAAEKFEVALGLFEQALALDATHSGAAFGMGYCLSRLGRNQEALRAYERAYELNPSDALLLGSLVDTYGDLGRWEDAVAYCQSRVALEGRDPVPHYGLGVAYRGMGRAEDATRALLRCVDLSKDDAWTVFNAGSDLEAMGQTTQAISAFRKAIAISPDGMETRLSLAGLLMSLERWTEAIDECKELVKQWPSGPIAYDDLGDAYFGAGQNQEALKAYTDAIRIGADSGWELASAYRGAGLVYLKMGRYSEAAESLRQAVRIQPGDAVSHYSLGIACYHSGDRGKALAEYSALADLDKELADALFKLLYP